MVLVCLKVRTVVCLLSYCSLHKVFRFVVRLHSVNVSISVGFKDLRLEDKDL